MLIIRGDYKEVQITLTTDIETACLDACVVGSSDKTNTPAENCIRFNTTTDIHDCLRLVKSP